MIQGHEQALAAYLADPERATPHLLGQLEGVQVAADDDLDALLRLLQRNKVPLLAIRPEQGRLQSELAAHPAFTLAQAAEAAQCARLREHYLAAQSLWRRAGIQDVVIKSAGTAPSFPYKTSNLDILVRPEQGDLARAILRRAGYVELRNVEENRKYLFRLFHEGAEVAGLHVHEHVGWYASFLDEEALWARCSVASDDPALTIPGDEDILLTTLAHFFYEDKDVKLSDLAAVHQCASQPGLDWEAVFAAAARRGWEDGLAAALRLCADLGERLYGATPLPAAALERAERALSPAARQRLRYAEAEPLRWPFRIPFALSKRYFCRRLWQQAEKRWPGRLADLAIHTLQGIKLRLRLHSQPHMLITFSGTDGSGKTVQAQLLQRAFAGCHIRARYVWSRGGSSRWVGWFTRLARRGGSGGEAAAPPSSEQSIARRVAMFRRPMVRAAWSWLTALELAGRYGLGVRWALWRGQVVICDRYAYDLWAEWAAYFGVGRGIERSLAARFLRWAAPRPDRAYLLAVPPEVAHQRSPEPPVAFKALQLGAYRELAPRFGAVVLDGERPIAELSDEIVYETLTRYFDRYWTLVNALFFRNPRPLPAAYERLDAGGRAAGGEVR